MNIKLNKKKIDKLIEAAKIKVLNKEPFLASIVAVMPIEVNEHIKTAATDGYYLYINPTFIQRLAGETDSVSELVELLAFVFAHEYTHSLLSHPERFEEYINTNGEGVALVYNLAADAEINERLRKDGFTVHKDAITEKWLQRQKVLDIDDSVLSYSTEQLYYKILQEAKRQARQIKADGKEDILSSDLNDGHKEGQKKQKEGKTGNQAKDAAYEEVEQKKEGKTSNINNEEREQEGQGKENKEKDISKGLTKQLKAAVDKAREISKQAAKTIGSGSSLANFIIKEGQRRRDWKKELLQYAKEIRDRENQSWNKIHKRKFFNLGIVYPAKATKKGFSNILVLFDTSASITQKEFQDTLADLLDIYKAYKPTLTIIQHTTKVTQIDRINSKEKLRELRIRESGGTDSEKAYKWVKEELKKDRDISLVIHFTDLYMENNKEYEAVRKILIQRGGHLVVVDTAKNKLLVNKKRPFRGW